MKITVVSGQNHFRYLSTEINLVFNEAVGASGGPGFSGVHVTQFDVSWQLMDFCEAVCYVLSQS